MVERVDDHFDQQYRKFKEIIDLLEEQVGTTQVISDKIKGLHILREEVDKLAEKAFTHSEEHDILPMLDLESLMREKFLQMQNFIQAIGQ